MLRISATSYELLLRTARIIFPLSTNCWPEIAGSVAAAALLASPLMRHWSRTSRDSAKKIGCGKKAVSVELILRECRKQRKSFTALTEPPTVSQRK